jgi:hypothetical protein
VVVGPLLYRSSSLLHVLPYQGIICSSIAHHRWGLQAETVQGAEQEDWILEIRIEEVPMADEETTEVSV